ncbi:ABC transporter substrate-binding protein [Desulfobacterales bacterium HSG16]|nr:ABC transporter substrate-binding protein [Desulfobacterales bacterium HSG16]
MNKIKFHFFYLMVLIFSSVNIFSAYARTDAAIDSRLALLKPIKIAFILAKTGIAARTVLPFLNMAKLAVEEINKQGGLSGQPVEYIILDNKSTPIGSSMAAEEAVRLQVTAVIGAIWSSHSLAIAPILQKAKIPMITPSSTNPRVTLAGNYIFRVCFIDSFQGKIMAIFARTEFDARTSVVLKILNEEYSLTLAEFFIRHFEKNGGKVIGEKSYKVKDIDFVEILKDVKHLNPEIVYIPGYSRDSGLLIRQADLMGIHTVFLGGDGWNDQIYVYGGKTVEGNFYSSQWHPDISSPGSIYLNKIYMLKYGTKIPVSNAALIYDSVMLLADAAKRAGTSDPGKIRKALAETKEFEGITGSITFDENGDPINKAGIIMKLGQNAPIFFKTVKP